MPPDAAAFLWDAWRATEAVGDFVQGRSREEYLTDRMLRSAVERQCEIIGEALNRLSKSDPAIAARLPDLRQAVAFRNLLIHGYATVDDAVVWRTATEDLPRLRESLSRLLDEISGVA
ncbi:MAG: DUF86 domain-containing protein [Acetobacteraceae bacterium]|nr:DUF86 domain-containing protein [Acetobacteraceae bacterium]